MSHNAADNVYDVRATWGFDAWALNWLGVAWRDNGGHVSGKIKLVDGQSHRLVTDHQFVHSIDGHGEVTTVWRVPAGDYELTLCDAKKSGGYHFPYTHAQPHLYSDVNTDWHTISFTVGT
ncbi:hypothetical protein [Streptomyces sp. NPDC058401]|uniref:hypothetical protein n=1 Tax=Streptomyces sp. NPDC058401 TaxID=3346480 RepID=UPI00364EA4DB